MDEKTIILMTDKEIFESLSYISGVFPGSQMFDTLVEEGAVGNEEHTIRGDDLAGACWHLAQLLDHFGIPRDYMEATSKYNEME